MAVTLVGTPQLVSGGGSYTAEAGSNRVVVFTIAEKVASGTTTLAISTLTYGARSLAGGTIISGASIANTANFGRGISAIYYVKEANIESGAKTIAATWNQAVFGTDLFTCYTLAGVDQTTPIDNTATLSTSSSVNPITGTIAVASNTVQILSADVASVNSSTPQAAWTEDRDTSEGTGLRVVAQHLATVAGTTVTWELNFSGTNSGNVAVVSFNPAAAAPASRLMMMGVS